MMQEVSFRDNIGRRISGVLHKSGSSMVIIAHGLFSSKSAYKQLAEILSENGISVLRFDFFGHGDSDGAVENLTIRKLVEDLKAAVDYASNLHFVEKIGLFGSSLGGMACLLLSANDSRISALALKAPVSDFRSTKFKVDKRAWRENGYAIFSYGEEKHRLKYNFYVDGCKYDVYAESRHIKCPVLIVHGEKDEIVPLSHSKRLLNVLGSEQKALEILSTGHRFDEEHREKLFKMCKIWFERWL